MINVCNLTLEHLATIPLSDDKAKTVTGMGLLVEGICLCANWTLYYAGVIVDQSSTMVDKFVSQAAIIDESNKNLNLALGLLNGISNQGDYNAIISQLIPTQNQVGLGQPLSSAQWIRTINTMLARNIVLNHLAPFVNGNPDATITKSSITPMSAADWQSVITLL